MESTEPKKTKRPRKPSPKGYVVVYEGGRGEFVEQDADGGFAPTDKPSWVRACSRNQAATILGERQMSGS